MSESVRRLVNYTHANIHHQPSDIHRGRGNLVTSSKKMEELDEVINWMHQQQGAVERARYGKNKQAAEQAFDEFKQRHRHIEAFQQNVQRASRKASGEDKTKLEKTYEDLHSVSDKKMHCFHSVLEITSLEDACATLATGFDVSAVAMVKKGSSDKCADSGRGRIPGFNAVSSQNCIFSVRDNWRWVVSLVHCIETHLKNAASYQQFFHEIDEYEPWMVEDLERLNTSFEAVPLRGEYEDAKVLLQELQDRVVSLRQWEAKVNFSWDAGNKVVPVYLRTQGVDDPTPIRALANYTTNDINIREDEDLLLLENKNSKIWRVRNNQGTEAEVPALICLIPGPFKEAIDAALRMRLRLLACWTNALKRVGRKLIQFMLQVFKPEYDDNEIQFMKSIRPMEKKDLLRILDFIEDTLKVHWGDNKDFRGLQEHILALRMILEEAPEQPFKDENVYQSLVVQIGMLEKLMDKYKDMWKLWGMFKVAVETSNSPELMLIVDKWEQLKFVDKDYFTKFWQMQLDKDLKKSGEGSEEGQEEEKVEMLNAENLGAAAESANITDGFETAETRTAETDTIQKASGEVKKTFTIRSVIDPRDETEISMQEAIVRGVINPEEGIYVNPNTGETIPIPVAMTQGKIHVSFSTTKRSQEQKSSVGIITVKTVREQSTFSTILRAKDMMTGQMLPKAEAVSRGILNEHSGIFCNRQDRSQMTINEAVNRGLVETEKADKSNQVESTTYAVRAVVDQRDKAIITFQQAVQRRIIDKDSGKYRNTVTGEWMYVGDAIMKGFLKARKVKDDEDLVNVDPKNKMIIDKTESLRKRLLKPLSVISAFKRAAAAVK